MTERCPTCSHADCPSIASRVALERAIKSNANALGDEAVSRTDRALQQHADAVAQCKASLTIPVAHSLDGEATQAGKLWAPPDATPEDIARRQRVFDAMSHKPKSKPQRRRQ